MSPDLLLHWHYLIFLVPFGVSALMLLLSSLQFGQHHMAHAGHSHLNLAGGNHAGAHHGGAIQAHGPGHSHAASHDASHGEHGGSRHDSLSRRIVTQELATHSHVMQTLFGIGRAPLPIIIEAFFLIWGLTGCLLNQVMLKGIASPGLLQVLPVIGIATGGALVGSRIAADLIGRVMPREESQVVSREGLFGLKGKVAFPVTETGGRIIIYDDHGSLHDETCRVASGQPPIARGRSALILDRDTQGNLLVEEVPD